MSNASRFTHASASMRRTSAFDGSWASARASGAGRLLVLLRVEARDAERVLHAREIGLRLCRKLQPVAGLGEAASLRADDPGVEVRLGERASRGRRGAGRSIARPASSRAESLRCIAAQPPAGVPRAGCAPPCSWRLRPAPAAMTWEPVRNWSATRASSAPRRISTVRDLSQFALQHWSTAALPSTAKSAAPALCGARDRATRCQPSRVAQDFSPAVRTSA